MSTLMLTTVDNPYNPFTEFDSWFAFDTAKGYNTCGLIDRFVDTSHELSDEDIELDTQDGLRRILRLFPLMYRMVDEENKPQPLGD